ncbi:hypothetical protein BD324DRAFT_634098 [Kockovaella imperatae]|uniref:Uncharacterized protein n=1 Tax=Kockovaella imperatae TaxID=4999 RepID=A0A1Y1UDL2_9TREE|nr:hypothetical protein BD324DRAFT_634098 [Kockovaella imperatae]ORX35165.1 hypothetical protein BD324DRAFT_634098 [Kockovaella imperatae]
MLLRSSLFLSIQSTRPVCILPRHLACVRSSQMSTFQSEINGESSRPILKPLSSSFRTRALAVTAAHRMASHTSPHVSAAGSGSNSSSSPPELGARLPGSGESFNSTSPLNGGPSARYRWLSSGQLLNTRTGDEPGVDVRSRRDEAAYGHLTDESHITVLDYCSNKDGRNTRADFDGSQLSAWLDSEHGERVNTEDGKPYGVRWIHVNKLNWQVIKTLTMRYNLHPLAVEDALQAENSHRSKIDFYKTHLYFQVLIQHVTLRDETVLAEAADEMALGKMEERFNVLDGLATAERRQQHGVSDSHHHQGGLDERMARSGNSAWAQGHEEEGRRKAKRSHSLPPGIQGVFEPTLASSPVLTRPPKPYQRDAHRLIIAQLTAKYMIPIRRAMLCAFMTRDGTMITFMDNPIGDALDPIYERLEDPESLLRSSQDVSMLAQALLDVSVDLALEVSSTFEAEILNLEASVLVDPSMQIVRHLHVLSSQLIRLRRSLFPILRLTSTIRDYDSQRSAAAAIAPTKGQGHPTDSTLSAISKEGGFSLAPSRTATPMIEKGNPISSLSVNTNPSSALTDNGTQVGFFSPMAKIYMVDVIDHVENAISSLDQFIGTCEHLTGYVFNVLSFQTNGSMERLSIVTVVFLPLTFIASYFGMNFTGFDQLQGPVSYFWKIAIPCTVGFFIVFSFSYLKWGAATLSRRIARWKRTRAMEKKHASRFQRIMWGKGGKGSEAQ